MINSLKLQQSKLSKLIDKNRTKYLDEYNKFSSNKGESHTVLLNISRDQLINTILQQRKISEKILAKEKEEWKNQIDKLSDVVRLDIDKLNQIGGIKTILEIKNNIENVLYKNVKTHKDLLSELKTTYLPIMHKDDKLDLSIKKIFEIIDNQIKLQDKRISDLDKIIDLMNINLKPYISE